MKKFPALAITMAFLVQVNTTSADTAPGDGIGNGGGAPPPSAQSVTSTSSGSVGIIGAAAFAAAVVFAGVVIARHPHHPSASSSRPAASADRTVSGRIVAVDPAANTLLLLNKHGEMVLNVEPDAKIKVDKESRLADLKTGTKIKVSYKIEGAEKVASRIW